MSDFNKLEDFNSERTPYSLVKLGKLYASAGRFDEAYKYYCEAIELLPEEAGFYFYRAIAQFNMNLLEESLEDFNTALQNNPINKYEILNFTGTCKYKLGDIKGALEDLEMVIEKHQGNVGKLKISAEEWMSISCSQ